MLAIYAHSTMYMYAEYIRILLPKNRAERAVTAAAAASTGGAKEEEPNKDIARSTESGMAAKGRCFGIPHTTPHHTTPHHLQQPQINSFFFGGGVPRTKGNTILPFLRIRRRQQGRQKRPLESFFFSPVSRHCDIEIPTVHRALPGQNSLFKDTLLLLILKHVIILKQGKRCGRWMAKRKLDCWEGQALIFEVTPALLIDKPQASQAAKYSTGRMTSGATRDGGVSRGRNNWLAMS
ncbi:hypothetical protein BD289DRAFT_157433 [Coniella lustricola]|uniref:Uncharacterized protein n=1 Tax=Coniella lustricola TaxID=2025994 RepID=A0A2T3AMM1_9PEZI|nr:hypothetical protein BD289DRAFT_157433 [Coniella lustricola]